ncbi:MAG TPA: TIGR03557 family F420-dependent LLM class oxidoreductase [Egibacteraceae bacterium]|nr:TIGR03557 family F420-dependent LLM class oxidoreductase [Egibacteraceae bacterium]
MVEVGYALSSEEHGPSELVRYAAAAEQAGFRTAMVSDHFHPWTSRQGQSPFVWSVLGGIAQATERIRVGTGVTCPTIRTHPAIIAHAAATAAVMLPGRFFLGVGSGEALNEHILGDHWPPAEVRIEMLEEAVAVMRLLWQGGTQTHYGEYYVVENARLFTLPDEQIPILVSAFGPMALAAATRMGDGYIGTSPEPDLVQGFADKAGQDKPRIGQMRVCWAEDEAQARREVFELWPTQGLPGQLSQDLVTVEHFEQAVSVLSEEQVVGEVPCGPDPERHLDSFRAYADAGYDTVCVQQVGADQEGFLRFYEREILPKLA